MGQSPIIGIVCGTRPEIVKLAPVYHALRDAGWARIEWIHTGQHAAMADEMLSCFDVRPTARLERRSSSLEGFSLECRAQLDSLLRDRKLDLCVVQGDTESAFLGALSAFYARIPVAHVEAGLRTRNLARPFPEEGLRQMISRIAEVHFAPTHAAMQALCDEGIDRNRIVWTGNTVIDAQAWVALRHGVRRARGKSAEILVTMHRREHWGGEMEEVFRAVADIARNHPPLRVTFPVHLNPVVQEAAQRLLAGIPNVRLTPPLDYLEMQRALASALLVLTDSGGLQEEAPTYRVPVLVLRHETERPEGVAAGCARLVGPHRDRILAETQRLLGDEVSMRRMRSAKNPYGDGRAARRIVNHLAGQLLQPISRSAE
jgi:UDP-N-acetylglucosamine 2-epimerase (non-hydrolysing)